MPASALMSGATGRCAARLLPFVLAATLGTTLAVRPAAAQQTAAPFFGRVPPVTLDNLLGRAIVPAAVAGHPTSAVASRTLTAADWPMARMDTTRNALLSQWLAFDDHSGKCAIRVRLLVLPLRGDTANVALAAQLWLLERIASETAQRFTDELFRAFAADVTAATHAGPIAPPRLPSLISYTDRIRQFMACGVGQSM